MADRDLWQVELAGNFLQRKWCNFQNEENLKGLCKEKPQ